MARRKTKDRPVFDAGRYVAGFEELFDDPSELERELFGDDEDIAWLKKQAKRTVRDESYDD